MLLYKNTHLKQRLDIYAEVKNIETIRVICNYSVAYIPLIKFRISAIYIGKNYHVCVRARARARVRVCVCVCVCVCLK